MTASYGHPLERQYWYFGTMDRISAEELLKCRADGTFLIRNSSTLPGDFVLSVNQSGQVFHYIIYNQQTKVRINNQHFDTVSSLLDYYKYHYIGDGVLIQPVDRALLDKMNPEKSKHIFRKQHQETSKPPVPPRDDRPRQLPFKVRAINDYCGRDYTELHFSRGEELEVFEIVEREWWRGRNCQGRVGRIPAMYVEYAGSCVTDGCEALRKGNFSVNMNHSGLSPSIRNPIYVKVTKKFTPTKKFKMGLNLKVGDVVSVIKIHENNIMEGLLNRQQGKFPANHVKILHEPIEESDEELT